MQGSQNIPTAVFGANHVQTMYSVSFALGDDCLGDTKQSDLITKAILSGIVNIGRGKDQLWRMPYFESSVYVAISTLRPSWFEITTDSPLIAARIRASLIYFVNKPNSFIERALVLTNKEKHAPFSVVVSGISFPHGPWAVRYANNFWGKYGIFSNFKQIKKDDPPAYTFTVKPVRLDMMPADILPDAVSGIAHVECNMPGLCSISKVSLTRCIPLQASREGEVDIRRNVLQTHENYMPTPVVQGTTGNLHLGTKSGVVSESCVQTSTLCDNIKLVQGTLPTKESFDVVELLTADLQMPLRMSPQVEVTRSAAELVALHRPVQTPLYTRSSSPAFENPHALKMKGKNRKTSIPASPTGAGELKRISAPKNLVDTEGYTLVLRHSPRPARASKQPYYGPEVKSSKPRAVSADPQISSHRSRSRDALGSLTSLKQKTS